MRRIVMAAVACVLAAAAFTPAVGARSAGRSHKTDTASAWDKQWLKTSLQGDLFEIRPASSGSWTSSRA